MNRKVSFFVIFLLIMISCGGETEQTISETTTSTILDTTSTSSSTTTTIVEINEKNEQKCPEDDNSNIDFSKTKNVQLFLNKYGFDAGEPDGIPGNQTIEAIKHSKAAGVPIIVAVNKCDLPGTDTSKVKNQLLEHELIVEEMGGDVLCNEISALKKTNLDKLKENILLQSELLDLKTKKNALAKGVVIESRLDKGKGPVSTVLITSGTLNRGNTFISGNTKGKVRAMFDYNNKQIKAIADKLN